MPQLNLLKNVSFGSRVAEDEPDLESYFVETAQWQRLASGEVDIVYGPKGSGKSALYALLLNRSGTYFDRGTILVAAENPRGAAAFQGLEQDPPTSEIEFVSMWKLYFAILLADALDEYGIANPAAKELSRLLDDAGLRRAGRTLASIVRSVVDYVRGIKAEATVRVDQTGAPVFGGQISLGEPDQEQRRAGVKSIDELLQLADDAWLESAYNVWLLLDRLDVAFADNSELEENALRALFRVYLDLSDKHSIALKIFLRSDIWERLAARGFREASHIVRDITIEWDKQSLLNLIVKRALGNEALRQYYGVNPNNTPRTFDEQVAFFARFSGTD